MSLTLKKMRSKLWYMSGKLDGGTIPKEIWNIYINNAITDICKLGVVRDRWATCDSVTDQTTYALPSYVHELLFVEVYDDDNSFYRPTVGVSLEWLNKNKANWRDDDSTTYPDYHYRMGQSHFGITPCFDAAVTDGIRIYYTRLGDEISSLSTTPKIPAQFHESIVKLAFIKLFPNHELTPKYTKEYALDIQQMLDYTNNEDKGRLTIAKP